MVGKASLRWQLRAAMPCGHVCRKQNSDCEGAARFTWMHEMCDGGGSKCYVCSHVHVTLWHDYGLNRSAHLHCFLQFHRCCGFHAEVPYMLMESALGTIAGADGGRGYLTPNVESSGRRGPVMQCSTQSNLNAHGKPLDGIATTLSETILCSVCLKHFLGFSNNRSGAKAQQNTRTLGSQVV